jgi:hypothetical protein
MDYMLGLIALIALVGMTYGTVKALYLIVREPFDDLKNRLAARDDEISRLEGQVKALRGQAK